MWWYMQNMKHLDMNKNSVCNFLYYKATDTSSPFSHMHIHTHTKDLSRKYPIILNCQPIRGNLNIHSWIDTLLWSYLLVSETSVWVCVSCDYCIHSGYAFTENTWITKKVLGLDSVRKTGKMLIHMLQIWLGSC